MADDAVAIVGLSFRFGGDASSTENFWDVITNGRCAVSPVPPSRFNADAFYHPSTDRLENLPVKEGRFVTGDIPAFDAPFFSVRPEEAAAMDPQSRKLLESTYRALENAGIPIEKCAGSKTCVFTGVSSDDYRIQYTKDPNSPIRHAATGMAISMLANKISWFYNFKGPSVQLDTACSASLTALHLAYRSIVSGESEMGVVGGANLFFAPESMSPLAHLNFFSPNARCFSFDSRANGYVRGEGCGVVVLKPLQRAIAENDPIRAVIRATGVNENGRGVGGITKVSLEAQQALVRQTYRSAGLDPSLTRYVEAHAPGTEGHRNADEPLYMGSVKANLGHLEGTSGIASIVKVVLLLEQGIIPKIANFETLHPKILAENYNMAFPKSSLAWPPGIRRASINSFGFGGANAHAVLEDAASAMKSVQRHRRPRTASHRPLLLVWSAADEGGAARIHSGLQQYIAKQQVVDGNDIAYTLAARRSRLPWKSFATLGDDMKLGDMASPARSLKDPKALFVYTGQGAQWALMGTQFMHYPIFKQSLARCSEHIKSFGADWDLEEELLRDAEHTGIYDARFSQPVCTAVQFALTDLMESFGLRPAYVIGHSSGEIGAAYATGAVSA